MVGFILLYGRSFDHGSHRRRFPGCSTGIVLGTLRVRGGLDAFQRFLMALQLRRLFPLFLMEESHMRLRHKVGELPDSLHKDESNSP